MDMGWTDKWYQEGLDAQADVETYDPLAVVTERLAHILHMTTLLTMINADEDALERKNRITPFLNTAYRDVEALYRRHDERHQRGWDFTPPKVTKTEARQWDMHTWFEEERQVPNLLVATHIGVARRLDAPKRRVAKLYNTTAVLLGTECDKLDWALDPDRQRTRAKARNAG